LIYDTEIKRNKNLIKLPISEEIKRLNKEIKKKTKELLFPKPIKSLDESQKGLFLFILMMKK